VRLILEAGIQRRSGYLFTLFQRHKIQNGHQFTLLLETPLVQIRKMVIDRV